MDDNGSAEFSPIWQDVHVRGNFKWNLKSGTDPASTSFSLRDPEGRLTKWELHLESPKSSEVDDYLLVLRSKNVFDLMIKWNFLIYLPNRHGNRDFSGTPEPELIRLNETRVAQVPALVLPSGQRLCLGPITISCQLNVFGSQAVNTSGPLTMDQGQRELLENLGELFLSEDTSDVDIISGDRTFHCHELILAARSPVFRAMFQVDMAERRSKRVEIQGLSSEVVANMLTFIYTGQVDLEDKTDLIGELMGAGQLTNTSWRLSRGSVRRDSAALLSRIIASVILFWRTCTEQRDSGSWPWTGCLLTWTPSSSETSRIGQN